MIRLLKDKNKDDNLKFIKVKNHTITFPSFLRHSDILNHLLMRGFRPSSVGFGILTDEGFIITEEYKL